MHRKHEMDPQVVRVLDFQPPLEVKCKLSRSFIFPSQSFTGCSMFKGFCRQVNLEVSWEKFTRSMSILKTELPHRKLLAQLLLENGGM